MSRKKKTKSYTWSFAIKDSDLRRLCGRLLHSEGQINSDVFRLPTTQTLIRPDSMIISGTGFERSVQEVEPEGNAWRQFRPGKITRIEITFQEVSGVFVTKSGIIHPYGKGIKFSKLIEFCEKVKI
jgi:hypothetical protein